MREALNKNTNSTEKIECLGPNLMILTPQNYLVRDRLATDYSSGVSSKERLFNVTARGLERQTKQDLQAKLRSHYLQHLSTLSNLKEQSHRIFSQQKTEPIKIHNYDNEKKFFDKNNLSTSISQFSYVITKPVLTGEFLLKTDGQITIGRSSGKPISSEAKTPRLSHLKESFNELKPDFIFNSKRKEGSSKMLPDEITFRHPSSRNNESKRVLKKNNPGVDVGVQVNYYPSNLLHIENTERESNAVDRIDQTTPKQQAAKTVHRSVYSTAQFLAPTNNLNSSVQSKKGYTLHVSPSSPGIELLKVRSQAKNNSIHTDNNSFEKILQNKSNQRLYSHENASYKNESMTSSNPRYQSMMNKAMSTMKNTKDSINDKYLAAESGTRMQPTSPGNDSYSHKDLGTNTVRQRNNVVSPFLAPNLDIPLEEPSFVNLSPKAEQNLLSKTSPAVDMSNNFTFKNPSRLESKRPSQIHGIIIEETPRSSIHDKHSKTVGPSHVVSKVNSPIERPSSIPVETPKDNTPSQPSATHKPIIRVIDGDNDESQSKSAKKVAQDAASSKKVLARRNQKMPVNASRSALKSQMIKSSASCKSIHTQSSKPKPVKAKQNVENSMRNNSNVNPSSTARVKKLGESALPPNLLSSQTSFKSVIAPSIAPLTHQNSKSNVEEELGKDQLRKSSAIKPQDFVDPDLSAISPPLRKIFDFTPKTQVAVPGTNASKSPKRHSLHTGLAKPQPAVPKYFK